MSGSKQPETCEKETELKLAESGPCWWLITTTRSKGGRIDSILTGPSGQGQSSLPTEDTATNRDLSPTLQHGPPPSTHRELQTLQEHWHSPRLAIGEAQRIFRTLSDLNVTQTWEKALPTAPGIFFLVPSRFGRFLWEPGLSMWFRSCMWYLKHSLGNMKLPLCLSILYPKYSPQWSTI